MNRPAFVEALASVGLSLDEAKLAAFDGFERALYDANSVMNLTRVSKEECWLRHFVDSLLFHDLIPIGATVLDIGTGPGFPAWPLALARPDLAVSAMDSSSKMLGFLAQIPLENLTLRLGRAECVSFDRPFDVVTGRAVAPLAIQLEISAVHCAAGGVAIPMRSIGDLDLTANQAVSKVGFSLERVVRRNLPGTEIERCFPVYRKARDVRSSPTRTWADMKRRPLF